MSGPVGFMPFSTGRAACVCAGRQHKELSFEEEKDHLEAGGAVWWGQGEERWVTWVFIQETC